MPRYVSSPRCVASYRKLSCLHQQEPGTVLSPSVRAAQGPGSGLAEGSGSGRPLSGRLPPGPGQTTLVVGGRPQPLAAQTCPQGCWGVLTTRPPVFPQAMVRERRSWKPHSPLGPTLGSPRPTSPPGLLGTQASPPARGDTDPEPRWRLAAGRGCMSNPHNAAARWFYPSSRG